MDIQPTNQQPMSDDQELAKVLAGVNQQADAPAAADETPAATPAATTDPQPAEEAPAAEEPTAEAEAPTMADLEQNATTEEPTASYSQPVETPAPVELSSDLESVKSEALNELRPLMDKLDISPEDKFNTYLLLLRSTDDKDLIAPAHEAAKNIADESARAKALLDIIKEIDYLSNPSQTTAEPAAPAAEAPATNYYQ